MGNAMTLVGQGCVQGAAQCVAQGAPQCCAVGCAEAGLVHGAA
jgi:hypothetical protein